MPVSPAVQINQDNATTFRREKGSKVFKASELYLKSLLHIPVHSTNQKASPHKNKSLLL